MENQENSNTNNHRSFLREFHQILSGKRSLARAAFNRLKPSQKRLLLEASGIKQPTTMIYNYDGSRFACTLPTNYDHLSDKELDSLLIGLRRLQSIINAFALCEHEDFKREHKELIKKVLQKQ
ncbi:hypothetical protein [Gilliamella apicola]|uniref:hypothetical protein n=1 Tax=Gilliamella apicola TaxID=1196095 RepID=UPI002FEE5F11